MDSDKQYILRFSTLYSESYVTYKGAIHMGDCTFILVSENWSHALDPMLPEDQMTWKITSPMHLSTQYNPL